MPHHDPSSLLGRARLAPAFLALPLMAGALSALSSGVAAGAQLADGSTAREPLDWGAREARHLLNRAGFGARPSEIGRWVAAGPDALIEELLSAPEPEVGFYHERIDPYDRERLKGLNGEPRRREVNRLRNLDRQQGRDFLAWWVEEMANGNAPLRERMTLFWSGLFTSGLKTVKRAGPMIEQNELLREHALGSYADLLREVLKDPAMLRYLDNDSNTQKSPNENLAREVMELFSLGEGNYSEQDVGEAARALTGRGLRGGGYHFSLREHDFGRKRLLNHSGRLDGDDLVDILLEQDACPRWIAGRLIEHLEGVEPSEPRLASYAHELRESGYQMRPFLRRLFHDPAFYRDEVVGARVASPIDFLVGACIRMNVRPPARFVLEGADIAGMTLFEPPNVKGWEGGLAWIDSGTLMTRGNLIGLLLGTLDSDDLELEQAPLLAMSEADGFVFDEPDEELDAESMESMMSAAEADADSMMSAAEDELEMQMMEEGTPAAPASREKSQLRKLATNMRRYGYRPRVYFTRALLRAGVESDAEITRTMLDTLLAIEAPAETYVLVERYLNRERTEVGLAPGQLLLGGEDSEPILRRLAHLILSLPEAQLH